MMKRWAMMWSCVIGVMGMSITLGAAEQTHVCRWCDQFHAAGGGGWALPIDRPTANGRQYAPHRMVDVLHVKIDVTPDFDKRTVAGTTAIRFKPIALPLKQVRLDAVDLAIHSVEATEPVRGHVVNGDSLVITFDTTIRPNQEVTVTIAHAAEPRKGLYFRTTEMGYREGDTHLWTQGEPHEARHWFPSFDYPNERFTSEVICRVPDGMIALSNGRLVGEALDEQTRRRAFHWLQDKPHVNYLIALVAGHHRKVEAKVGDIPLAFYAPPSQIEHVQNSFRDTADMMVFFEKEIGVPYPWDRYDQVVVDDFIWGGMENTTLTILTDRTLYSGEFETARSSQNLVAHELVHQWFGDYITCKDWSHLWLNEGFATYYAHLYDEHKHGREALLYGMYRDARNIINRSRTDTRPIVFRGYATPKEQFDYRAYPKGSWVLHMLRSRLGPELYRKCVTQYVLRNAQRSVETPDLSAVFEEQTGLSLAQFFDQWVYHGGVPSIEVSQSWDEATKLAKVTVKQTHEVSDRVLLFRFPVTLRFRTANGVVDHAVEVTDREHDFFVPLPEKPDVVRFDPQYSVLAEVSFKKPRAMLFAQLDDEKDVIGRLLAVEQLKSHDDGETLERLTKVLRDDPYWGVRVEASAAIRERAGKEKAAFEALAGSLDQPDARVRERVVQDIASVYRAEVPGVLLKVIEGETNPDVASQAVRGLALFDGEACNAKLIELLASRSYKHVLAAAAVDAIRRRDDPRFVEPLMQALHGGESQFTSRDFGRGLDALAYIARHENDRESARTFLLKYVTHQKRTVQTSAIRALGTLGDARAIAALQAFDAGPDGDPVKQAAGDALRALRDGREAPAQVRELREQVLELQKQNERLRERVDEVLKKVEAKLQAND